MDFGKKMGRGQYVVARGSKQRMARMRIMQQPDRQELSFFFDRLLIYPLQWIRAVILRFKKDFWSRDFWYILFDTG